MATDQVPSTIDAGGGDLTAITPQTVQPSLKDRIMGGAGSIIQSAAGGDPTAATPLSQAIDKHHKQMADEANMHQKNYANMSSGLIMVRHGINPETGQRFDDPNYQGEDHASMDAKYLNWKNAAYQNYLKSAGKTKELKDAITTQGNLIDHVTNAVTQQANPKNAATNAARAGQPTAPAGGLQPPPGSGGSPAAPGTTSSPASGVAAPDVSDEGNPGTASSLTPPPKSDNSGPAAAAAPAATAAPAAKGNPQVSAPPAPPPAPEPYNPLEAIAQSRYNARAQAIADQQRADKRNIDLYAAKNRELYTLKEEQDAKKIEEQARNPRIARFTSKITGKQLPDDAVDQFGNEIPQANRGYDHVYLSPDGGRHFVEVSDDYERKKVGNEYRVYSKHDPTDVGQVVSGPVDLGHTSTSSEPGVDAEGNAATLHKSRTTTPVTASSSQAPATSAGTGATVPPKQTSSPAPATPKPGGGSAASPTSTAGGKVPVFTPAQYNTFRKVKTPLMEASTQIFGDPTDPNYKSLESYADIASNPQESAALAVAVRRSIAGLDEKMKGAGTGLTDLIKNETGFTNQLISSQADADRDAIGGLSARNKEAYAAIMSALGAMIGVRAATGGSAAKFSALALEREIPIPGVNSFSTAQFNKQLNGIAGEIKRGSQGIPIFSDDERKYINQNQTRTGVAAAGKEGSKVVHWTRKPDGTLGPG